MQVVGGSQCSVSEHRTTLQSLESCNRQELSGEREAEETRQNDKKDLDTFNGGRSSAAV